METNRRRFLASVGVTASAALLAPSVFDFDVLAGPVFVRPDIGTLALSDPIIVGYQTAVAAMQALPITNVTSWAYQAAIHATTVMPIKTAWDTCQHGTNFFWAWHRMYLYWWERIVRKYSGNPNWAVPYWNWSATTERTLPTAFQVVTSDLYTVNRNSFINNGTGSLPATDVDYTVAFSDLAYYTAMNDLEGTPHGAVHVDVGGWMANIPTAAQDPIFYLHHCNIDRLWDLWLAQGGGRSDPTSDTTWTTKVFTFFDENGKKVTMTPCDILNAATQLNYSYAGEPPQVVQTCGVVPPWKFIYFVLFEFQWPPGPIGPDPYVVAVDISTIVKKLESVLANPMEEVFLELDGVSTATQPGATWEVYVGLPAGVAPDPSSPFYVGKMALFGEGVESDAHGKFKPAKLRFNATQALGAVIAAGGSSAPISFYARGILINGQPSQPSVQSTVTVTEGKFVVQKQESAG